MQGKNQLISKSYQRQDEETHGDGNNGLLRG